MKWTVLTALALAGCATVQVSGEGSAGVSGPAVEVNGHVVSACPARAPQSNESVTIRAAGELDALDTTQTDANGEFTFRVVPKGDVVAPMFIEARGQKALVKARPESGKRLVAELVLPCGGDSTRP